MDAFETIRRIDLAVAVVAAEEGGGVVVVDESGVVGGRVAGGRIDG